MTLAAGHRPWTLDEFLEWEEAQEEKYELVGGVIRAMVGGTVAHNMITGNIFGVLTTALRGSFGRVFIDGMKLVTRAGDVTYPDVIVSCGSAAPTDTRIEDAIVVVEVLSRGTEGFDRGAKWLSYQSLPMLRHYVLVAQDRMIVESYTRKRAWLYERLEGPNAVLRLDAVDAGLSLAEIYDGVFDPAALPRTPNRPDAEP